LARSGWQPPALAIAEECLSTAKPELAELAAGNARAIVDAASEVRRRDGDAKTAHHVAFALLSRVYQEETERQNLERVGR
jgi:hypothetical protein